MGRRSASGWNRPRASFGLDFYNREQGKDDTVIATVYPDRRGAGFGLSRHNEDLRLDFTRIEHCEDVRFAHCRGFVAKTSATNPERLRELLALAFGAKDATAL